MGFFAFFCAISTVKISSSKAPEAWAADYLRREWRGLDPDAAANGVSGPNGSTGSKLAKINNNNSPTGGPTTCPWTTNNCGPNDEPFGFHSGGCNAVMADGSVRFMKESIGPDVLKFSVGADDGQVVNLD